MFPLAIQPPYRAVLMGLLAAWLLLLVAAFAFGKDNAEHTRHSISALLMSTSGLLVVAAFIWWRSGSGDPALAGVSFWLLLGMTAGFAGDMILAGHVPFLRGTLPGMAAFSVTHICYLIAFDYLAGALNLADDGARLAWIGGYLVVGVALWFILVSSPAVDRALNYGALGYALLISAMTGFAVALAARRPALAPLAFGANLFWLSDILLANQLFRRTNWRHVHDVVWVLYIFGQALIVFSNSTLARLVG